MLQSSKRAGPPLVVLLLMCSLGYVGYRFVRSRDREECPACAREIHTLSRTVALAGGKSIVYCCPACALWEARQSNRKSEIVELTDHSDGGRLKPSGAHFVVASDLHPCHAHAPTVGQDSQPVEITFDRCQPSVLAFASRAAAEQFARAHGGRITTLAELSAEIR